jgi:hypothetical protein
LVKTWNVKPERRTWQARAWELLEALEAGRLSPVERVQERSRWEDWEALRAEAAEFAAKEIGRRKWRGAQDGVLPGGLEAEDIAGQAIAELLGGKCRLALGYVRSKLKRELERLVSQKVRLLHRLKEAPRMRSEWDVAPVEEGDEPVSVFDALPDEGAGGDGEATERDEIRKRLEKEFVNFLHGEAELLAVFGCLCAGVTRSGEIARQLGMDERAVVRARRRLDRRLAEFARQRKSRRGGLASRKGRK